MVFNLKDSSSENPFFFCQTSIGTWLSIQSPRQRSDTLGFQANTRAQVGCMVAIHYSFRLPVLISTAWKKKIFSPHLCSYFLSQAKREV